MVGCAELGLEDGGVGCADGPTSTEGRGMSADALRGTSVFDEEAGGSKVANRGSLGFKILLIQASVLRDLKPHAGFGSHFSPAASAAAFLSKMALASAYRLSLWRLLPLKYSGFDMDNSKYLLSRSALSSLRIRFASHCASLTGSGGVYQSGNVLLLPKELLLLPPELPGLACCKYAGRVAGRGGVWNVAVVALQHASAAGGGAGGRQRLSRDSQA